MKWVKDSYEKGGSNGGSEKKGGSNGGSEKKGGIQKGGSNKKKGGSKAGSHKKVGGKAAGSGKDMVNDKIPDKNVSKYVCLCFFCLFIVVLCQKKYLLFFIFLFLFMSQSMGWCRVLNTTIMYVHFF